ncbi:MAG TPA: hypothetical protein DCM68_07735 [Verrucomicrobia bacterium]|nr:hypothetical protein [Verrucomicrobiota bacterium]
MALINFDCPECGHNLEVDEGGAGFIVKCPECGNPLQIPELPRSHRIRKIVLSAATLLAIVALSALSLFWGVRAQALQKQVDEMKPLAGFLQRAQADSMEKEAEIARLKDEKAAMKVPRTADLVQSALAAIEETESLSQLLEKTSRRLLESSESERVSLLRNDMKKRVEAAKNGLPATPILTDVDPGQGIQGRQIVFPVLPGPDGQVLRENAEVTSVDGDKVSVKFDGGTATYGLTELHPGVAAFLPVDPLLVLPRRQWGAEVFRVQQTLNAERDQRIAGLRSAIEAHLPAE